MGLVQLPRLLVATRTSRRLEQLTGDLVERCRGSVREEVTPKAVGMSAAETRGFVQAYATPIVRREVTTRLASESPLAEWAREELTDRVGRQVVDLVTADLGRAETRIVQRRAG